MPPRRPAGQPFSSRGPDAIYRLTRPGSPIDVTITVNMKGTEYHRVEISGTGSDGGPIQYSYRDHYNGKLGVGTFVQIAGARGTQVECVHDTRPTQLQNDLSRLMLPY